MNRKCAFDHHFRVTVSTKAPIGIYRYLSHIVRRVAPLLVCLWSCLWWHSPVTHVHPFSFRSAVTPPSLPPVTILKDTSTSSHQAPVGGFPYLNCFPSRSRSRSRSRRAHRFSARGDVLSPFTASKNGIGIFYSSICHTPFTAAIQPVIGRAAVKKTSMITLTKGIAVQDPSSKNSA